LGGHQWATDTSIRKGASSSLHCCRSRVFWVVQPPCTVVRTLSRILRPFAEGDVQGSMGPSTHAAFGEFEEQREGRRHVRPTPRAAGGRLRQPPSVRAMLDASNLPTTVVFPSPPVSAGRETRREQAMVCAWMGCRPALSQRGGAKTTRERCAAVLSDSG
jgi:hypothetical protein